MKRIFFALIALTFAALGNVSQAQTLTFQAQITPSKTVDLLSARAVSLKPGSNYVWDHNGNSHMGAFRNIGNIINNQTFISLYVLYKDGLYINVSQATSIDCVNSTSVISWQTSQPHILSDGCAFNDAVKALSRF